MFAQLVNWSRLMVPDSPNQMEILSGPDPVTEGEHLKTLKLLQLCLNNAYALLIRGNVWCQNKKPWKPTKM